eukprot:TRINITY_DN23516_c0_g1_i1.p1 TRINITY_DN23516_c0_g1~~TRINITY_DN23516_c0_g1_i1.p1  ORF type:complete len:256 (+),score=40.14 TRINITY_DN23516_c0_g1_i1:485-1252(+)
MSCHETLWGRFTVSLWGQFLCSKCPVRSCLGCQGLLAKPEDGPNCGRCNSTAVTEDQLVALQAEVMQVLSKYGIEFGAASIPVSLSTQAGLTESSAKSTGRLLGLTQKSHARGSLFRTRRRAEVLLAENMPRVQAAATLAHEMMHAWLYLQGFDQLPDEVEEGLCELSAYTWLTDMVNSPESSYDKEQLRGFCEHMERDSSPVYGVGFHAAAAALHGRRLSQLLSYVRTYHVFPPFHYSPIGEHDASAPGPEVGQ